MKFTIICSLSLAMFVATSALAQTDSMKGMNDTGMKMKDMDMQKCMDMKGMNMKASDMKGMDTQKCKAMMPGNKENHASKKADLEIHKVTGVVKEVDAIKGKVVLDHQAVKSLNWPAMTMGFMVTDRKLLGKLTVGKRVAVELRKEGADYVVVAVK